MVAPMGEGGDMHLESPKPKKIPHWRQVVDQGAVIPDIAGYPYVGSGTEEDPYVVHWIPDDPRNPMLFSNLKKWSLTLLVSAATLAVALISSAYTGGVREIMVEFSVGDEVVTLGVSLFVLGFAIGPLLWAPISELYGRQILFVTTYCALTAFNAGAAGSKNIQTLLILRFFAGSFGSSILTNAGAVIADMFSASHRGLALGVFAIAPFLGPVLGPIVGGFLGMTEGWRWVEGFLAIFSGALWIAGSLLLPETYAPVLLRKRAQRLSKLAGKVFRSKIDIEQGKISPREAFHAALLRPWVLLFREPIVLLLSIYMAIIYGILYMLFGAFPIVFQEHRGWNEGVGGLAFLGVMVGMLIAMATILIDNKRYLRVAREYGGFAPPETRLPLSMIGGVAIPVGLFWFAWTDARSVHFLVSISAGIPFGFGLVLIFLGVTNYLVDAYTIFAASVLAANTVLRSLFGAAFPLFTRQMYQTLGIHWAAAIPAFLALARVPMPFFFYKYGLQIRRRCKYAAEADMFMRKLQEGGNTAEDEEIKESSVATDPEKAIDADSQTSPDGSHDGERSPSQWSSDDESPLGSINVPTRFMSGRQSSVASHLSRTTTEYNGNPYDIDRVNTRDSALNRNF